MGGLLRWESRTAMTQAKVVRRRKTVDELFAEGAVPRLTENAARRVIESAGLPLRSPMDFAVDLVGSFASRMLIMEYNAPPGGKRFRAVEEAFEIFAARIGDLAQTTAAAPIEVRKAVQCISEWLDARSKIEVLRRGEKPATRRREYRDNWIILLFIEFFGEERVSETVERPGIGNHGAAARFMLAFYAEMHQLLAATPAADERAAEALDRIQRTWKPPTSEQVRGAIRDRERKSKPDEAASN